MPVGYASVGKSVIDLCAGINCYALDIDYALKEDGSPDFSQPTKMIPTEWDEWIALPIRSWDNILRSPSMQVRVPTVLIAKNFDKMPTVRYGGKPSSRQIFDRDKGIDQYTGKKLTVEEASVDHVIPTSKGGTNDWHNMVLTHKLINFKKGNKFNDEVGLRLIKEPTRPAPQPMYALITEARHVDWQHFLIKQNKV
jgi:5-methylcytosine-specific restriction endonuclease McrA